MSEHVVNRGVFDALGLLHCPSCGQLLDFSECQPREEVSCANCNRGLMVPVGMMMHYGILRKAGEGATSSVFEAHDFELDRKVAIKILHPEDGVKTRKTLAVLREEARLVAALNDPHIMQIYAMGTYREAPYLAVEFLPGPALDRSLRGGQSMDEAEALRIGVHVARGLKAIDVAGMAHGDVKPANIRYGRCGRAKLADFGVAQSKRCRRGERKSIVGTPYYLAPEQALSKVVTSTQADQYSLGASLFHLIAGQPPFNGETVKDVLNAVRARPIPSLKGVFPDVSVKTSILIRRMMSRDPENRFESWDELISELVEARRLCGLMERYLPSSEHNVREPRKGTAGAL